MKIFFDTNVLIAAFVAHGVCGDLFEYCLAEHTICISQRILDELYENLTERFDFSRDRVEQEFYRANLKGIPKLRHILSPLGYIIYGGRDNS